MDFLRSSRICLIISFSVFLWLAEAVAERTVTTVLLPSEAVSEAVSEPPNSSKILKVTADDSYPIVPTSIVRLKFDLKNIPAETEGITQATLRLVGRSSIRNPQIVKIFTNKKGEGEPLASWFAKCRPLDKLSAEDRAVRKCLPENENEVFSVITEALREEVEKARDKGDLTLWLISTSRLSNWDYYSTEPDNEIAAQKPRLIVAYTLPIPSAVPPERTAWRFYTEKISFKVKPFQADETIRSNPVFYNGNAFLFARPTAGSHDYLYALHTNGRDKWPQPVKVDKEPAVHAAVTYNGMLYSVGRGRIARYDLNQNGAPRVGPVRKDLKLSLAPALGTVGSLYYEHDGTVYAINPQFQYLWRYPQEGKGSVFSPIVLSPSAQNQAYVVARIDEKNKLVAIDTATGHRTEYPFDTKYTDFHPPVVIPGSGLGTESDFIYLAVNSQMDGLLACFSAGDPIWSNEGPVSQPVASADGERLFAVQNGSLHAYDRLNGQSLAVSTEKDLAADSNLVLDGDDNVYFWNNHTLFQFDRNCQFLAGQKLTGLAEKLVLVFAPDGTLFARNLKDRRLALILPEQDKVTVDSSNLQSGTIFSADVVQIAPNLQLVSDSNIALKARDGISIGKGFTVKTGARLTCKTGF